jgi:hypothetical protein
MAKKIEARVADTILQEPIKMNIDGKEYTVASPCTATLIRVSELIASNMPAVSFDKINITNWTLMYAKDCKAIGDIAAVLILGVDGLIGTKKVKTPKKHFFGLTKHAIETEVPVNFQEELSDLLLRKLSPVELATLIKEILDTMGVSSFFGLTTSLIEINLLRQTKEEVVTTASGQ